MRAVVIDRFGPPDVLGVRDVDTPAPGQGEVRVEVHAAGVNPVDAQNRADGEWAGLSLPAILGSDFSGVVDVIGEGVTEWSEGEKVFGLSPFRGSSNGTYAEYHVAAAGSLLRKPGGLTHVEAAAIPLAAATALEVIDRRLAIEDGELVLVHGAGGGVGSFAVQLAAGAGASVIASASERHHELLGRLGADLCLDYRRVDVAEAARERTGRELDAVADFVGGDAIARSLAAMREGGRAASVVSLEGDLEPAIDGTSPCTGSCSIQRTRSCSRRCKSWRRRAGCSPLSPRSTRSPMPRALIGISRMATCRGSSSSASGESSREGAVIIGWALESRFHTPQSAFSAPRRGAFSSANERRIERWK